MRYHGQTNFDFREAPHIIRQTIAAVNVSLGPQLYWEAFAKPHNDLFGKLSSPSRILRLSVMQYKKCISICVLVVLAAVTVRADPLDDYLRSEMQIQHIPGLSIAVVKDGKIVRASGYGLANVELSVNASAETVYKIGSISKQFISAAILLLLQDGKLHLDDSVSRFFTDAPSNWRAITVRHLLTHTSGLGRDAPGFDPLKNKSDIEVIRSAYPLRLLFKPGDQWRYSNVGYFVLAEIIHRLTNQAWADYVDSQIFRPLAMNATRTTTATGLDANRANGYIWKENVYEKAPFMVALRPSGAFISTVVDLAKWDSALYSDKILNQMLRGQTWTPVQLNDGTSYLYGFGWYLNPLGGHRCLHHDGSLPGFRSEIARFIDDRLTVIILTNGDSANASMIAVGVAGFYLSPA